MLLYSCDHGQTVVDNYDESFIDTEKELMSEVWDIVPAEEELTDEWSGEAWDFFQGDSFYTRPSLF